MKENDRDKVVGIDSFYMECSDYNDDSALFDDEDYKNVKEMNDRELDVSSEKIGFNGDDILRNINSLLDSNDSVKLFDIEEYKRIKDKEKEANRLGKLTVKEALLDILDNIKSNKEKHEKLIESRNKSSSHGEKNSYEDILYLSEVCSFSSRKKIDPLTEINEKTFDKSNNELLCAALKILESANLKSKALEYDTALRVAALQGSAVMPCSPLQRETVVQNVVLQGAALKIAENAVMQIANLQGATLQGAALQIAALHDGNKVKIVVDNDNKFVNFDAVPNIINPVNNIARRAV